MRICLLTCALFAIASSKTSDSHNAAYTNDWVAEVSGGRAEADRVANQMGFRVKRAVEPFDDMYLMTHEGVTGVSKRGAHYHTKRLSDHDSVRWAAQEVAYSRSKRSVVAFNDPEWEKQWYLHDTRVSNTAQPKMDLHVIPAWNKGYTGKGVVVTILDDGLEHNNTDIKANYDPKASYDINDNDDDPFPRYDPTNENKHGTRCAAEVSMVANNSFCGVGVAYNAKIGGIRILDGSVTDSVEAQALAYNLQHIHIYSASWGPNDDGMTLEGPGVLVAKAYEMGIKKGRGGLGVLYVWASGNGGTKGDNCDCDGYTASPYTISISSATQNFNSPWYAEHCASTMATTFSSGSVGESKIVAADLHNLCTEQHSGTSASAPLAAGIFALALEANPKLNWRDVQHLVAYTSEYVPLKENAGWNKNAAGFYVNTRFGFGLLNAASLVEMAESWKTVPDYVQCESEEYFTSRQSRAIHSGETYDFELTSDGCKGKDNEVNYIEHVQLYTTVDYNVRGVLSINLTSAQGTRVMLLSPRSRDTSTVGIQKWPFMSVHSWGEQPAGTWKVTLTDQDGADNKGAVRGLRLLIWGTKEKPSHYQEGGRVYNKDYNKVLNERSNRDTRKEPTKGSEAGTRRSYRATLGFGQ